MRSKTARQPEGAARIIGPAIYIAALFLAIFGILLMADHAPFGMLAVAGCAVLATVAEAVR